MRKFRYELRSINSGPFKMWEVLDNKYNPPRKLLTTSDEGEAHKYIQSVSHEFA